MTRDELTVWLIAAGYRSLPIYPHIFYNRDGNRRYRMTAHGVRHEERTMLGHWIRLESAYLKDLSIGKRGRLRGLKRNGMRSLTANGERNVGSRNL